MSFHLFEGEEALVPDACRIPAPPKTAPVAVPTKNTLCLVPGLAADKQGARLGYGGGYYDRFLPAFLGVSLFPLYSCFLCNALPREETDVPVSHILTEKGELVPCQS